MAKKGNNNKNKVTRPGTGKFQELDSEGKVKYHDKYLDNTRRKMKAVNMASRRGNELLAQETKHVSNITKIYGEHIKQEKDMASLLEGMYSRQQEQTKTVEQLYGLQNKLADKLKLSEGYALEIATAQRETRDMSLQDLNTNRRTQRELATINRLKTDAVNHAQKLTLYNKENIPYYDKMNKIQAEIAVLTEQVGNNVDTEKAHRLAVLKTMHKEYETLGKLEKSNTRKEEIQNSINDLMTLQGTAAGTILQTLKDIITNPLLIFTGLLALGVSRMEEMRGYGNQLAEELDRVNKKLAGSGPYQQAIIKKARTIHSIFRAAGEGFAGSLESAVDAVQALQKQLGNINLVSGDLVNLMSTIKLSINLSDDEVAKVIDTYLIVGEHSEKAAINSANMLYSMSEAVGLDPAVTFKEIADATGETLAHFRGGTKELNEAVIAARKMGLGLDDVAKISKGLLDFESSIEAEMEAQMLTGMNINFNKARHFAMNKQGAKAAQEVLRQVGGLKKFQDMNIFQQEAIARATGLSVDELLKTNLQRERENKINKEKQQIHDDTVKMLPVVTKVMGKIETGLGIIEKIANILGDIVLDVFGVSFKEAEELILRFVKSDTFQTGLKNLLYFVKGIIEGIVDAITTIWDFVKNLPFGIGDFVQKMGSMDMSGGYGGAQKVGKGVGKVLAYGYMAKTLLGATPFTAMWIQSAGGALKGIGGIIAKGVKSLFGYGGQAAGTGLAGAATTAGWLTAGAFVAKGLYDVATLSGKSTRSEKAGAIGGAVGAIGGAKAGAAIGTMIAPGVGTAIGAGIGAAVGYIGGQAVKHISWFQDDLDKSRIKLAESEHNLVLEANAQNNQLNLRIVKAQNDVRQKFIDFGLTTDGASKNEIKAFADAMLDAGNLTKGEHKLAISGTMSAIELLERAAAGAGGQLTKEQEARKIWVENQMNEGDLERVARLEYNKELYAVIESLSDDMIEDKITRKGLSERGKIDYVLNPFRTEHDRDVLVREMYRLYEGVVPMDKIKAAVEEASHGIDFYVTKTDAVESGLEDLRDQLLQDVELLINEDQKLHNEKKLKLMKKANDMQYDRLTDGLIVTPKENPNEIKARGGILSAGGLLSSGGTPSKYAGRKFSGGGVTGDTWLGNKLDENGLVTHLTKGGNRISFGGTIKQDDWINKRIDTGKWGYNPRTGAIVKLKNPSDGMSSADKALRDKSNPNLSDFRRQKIGLPGGPDDPKVWDFKNLVGVTPKWYGASGGGPKRNAEINKKILDGTHGFVGTMNKGEGGLKELKDGRVVRWPSIHHAKKGRPYLGGLAGGRTEEIFGHLNSYMYTGEGGNSGIEWGIDLLLKQQSTGGKEAATKLVGEGIKTIVPGGKLIYSGYKAHKTGKKIAEGDVFGSMDGLEGGEAFIEAMRGVNGLVGGAKGVNYVMNAALERFGKQAVHFMPQILVRVSNVVGWGLLAYDLIRFMNAGINSLFDAWEEEYYQEKQKSAIQSEKQEKLINQITSGGSNIPMDMDSEGLTGSGHISVGYQTGVGGMQRGGITPNIKQVNDMILTADGQLIETHEDDNIIAKKGGITQKSGGSSSKDLETINSLLRELIIVSNDTVVEVDGKIISENLQVA